MGWIEAPPAARPYSAMDDEGPGYDMYENRITRPPRTIFRNRTDTGRMAATRTFLGKK